MEPLNCGSFLDKIYRRLHENVLEVSLKIVYERIWDFRQEEQATLNARLNLFYVPVFMHSDLHRLVQLH